MDSLGKTLAEEEVAAQKDLIGEELTVALYSTLNLNSATVLEQIANNNKLKMTVRLQAAMQLVRDLEKIINKQNRELDRVRTEMDLANEDSKVAWKKLSLMQEKDHARKKRASKR